MIKWHSWQNSHEWFDPQEDLEVISLDEISKDQYDDFVDHLKQ